MSLIIPEDYEGLRRQRDRELKKLEKDMEAAADEMMRSFLSRVMKGLRPGLTAAALPSIIPQLLTLGTINGWWEQEVDAMVRGEASAAFLTGRRSISDLETTRGSLDAVGSYVANVTDRLSRTAQPTIGEQTFDTLRRSFSEELARGSSTDEISRRIASDLSWTGPDRGLWEDRLEQANRGIDRILDPIGPPGDPNREAMRLNDPDVRALQADRSAAVRELDRDQSVWATRAERIARTETTAAYNAGAQQALFEEGAGAKMWIATADERTRETHLEVSGTCVPVAAPFVVGGAELVMPGDPSGPPEETINCRCTMIGGETCAELRGITEQAEEVMDREREERGMDTRLDRDPVGIEDPGTPLETNPLDASGDVETIPGEREFAEPTHRQIENFSQEELERIEERTQEKKDELASRLAGIDETTPQYQNAQSDHVIKYGNDHLGSIYEAQGFDALPTVVDNLDAIPGGEKIYRGISSVSSSQGVIEGQVLAEGFRSGPTHWPGLGAIGSGSYSSTIQQTAARYASGGAGGAGRTSVGGPGGSVLEMKMKPGARIVDHQAASKAMKEEVARRSLQESADPSGLNSLRAKVVGDSPFAYAGGHADLGEWAALNGFDAMRYISRDSAGTIVDTYYVILNRGAVYVQR